MNLALQRAVFGASSRITEMAPEWGARLLDATLRPVLGCRALGALHVRRNRGIIRRARGMRRFLLVPDIHIGDAVVTESALGAVRDFFPDAEVDYAVNRTVAPLIEGHPDATRVLPVFSGAQFPGPSDLDGLRTLIRDGDYDLVLGFGPFMDVRALAACGQPFVSFLSHASALVRNESDQSAVNHFSYQHYHFVRDVLGGAAPPLRPAAFPGPRTTLSEKDVQRAAEFAAAAGVSGRTRVVVLNPDGACRFNVLPFDDQVALLMQLGQRAGDDATIMVGAGHTVKGIGDRLVAAMPERVRRSLRIIPRDLDLGAYVALLDLADVFVTGDTGPMHLAAARRHVRSGSHRFRNRTAVLSVFGATVPRMSGYDSARAGYLPANQDAPSWCYVAPSPCRNITCLNKYFKTCRTVRCFEGVDAPGVAELVVAYLETLRSRERIRAASALGGLPASLEPAVA